MLSGITSIILCGAACLLAASQVSDVAPTTRPTATADFELKSSAMTVGFSRSMGGAIVLLSVDGGPNLVNVHDAGRLVQQSYYAGKVLERDAHHPAWKRWAWNPIQGGDAFNFTPGCSKFELLDDGRFFTETTGLNWPARNERLRSTIRQWARFKSPRVLEVTCEFVSDRAADDEWGDAAVPRHQELPAAYFIADLSRLVTYRDDKLVEFPHKMWNFAEPMPEHWAACVDERGLGVGVVSPDADKVNIGKAGQGAGDDKAATTMHIAPIVARSLKPRDELRYTYYLIAGDVESIRTEAKRLATK